MPTARSQPVASPMIAQYQALKAEHPECLLFFRMGDFYELFFEDAQAAAPALDIALTKRGRHQGDDIPMCGVPVHSAESYLERLIRKGFKVAICEQTEDPAEARKRGGKTLVRREVIRLVTPGTLTEDSLLEARRHNFLAALARSQQAMALAWLDISTGEFLTGPVADGTLPAALARLEPGELLLPEGLLEVDALRSLWRELGERLTPLPEREFNSLAGERRLKASFGVRALDGFGSFSRAELGASGALLSYVELTQKGRLPRLAPPRREAPGDHLVIDPATRRNLELLAGLGGGRQGSLLAAIDRTVTGAGGRLLASRLAAPLAKAEPIRRRLDAVEALLGDADAARRPAPRPQRLPRSRARGLAALARPRRPARPRRDPQRARRRRRDPRAARRERLAARRKRALDRRARCPGRKARGGAGGRSAVPRARWRLRRAGLARGSRPAAHAARPDAAPHRAARGARPAGDRHRLAEDPPQQPARLLHRGHPDPSRQGARPFHPAPEHGRRDALQHRRARRAREPDRERRRARADPRARAFFRALPGGAGRRRGDREERACARPARRRGRPRRARGRRALLPPRGR